MKIKLNELLAAVLAAAIAPSLAAAAPGMDFDRGFDLTSAMETVQVLVLTPGPAEYPCEECCSRPENRKGKTKLAAIEGIGGVYAATLRDKAGLITLEDLLGAGAGRKGRKALEKKTAIGHKLILEWVNLADLMRIDGVGEEYSDLLEEAGVDTVKELRRRVPESLYRKMAEVNGEKRLVRRLPSLSQVEDWVIQAGSLRPLVTY